MSLCGTVFGRVWGRRSVRHSWAYGGRDNRVTHVWRAPGLPSRHRLGADRG